MISITQECDVLSTTSDYRTLYATKQAIIQQQNCADSAELTHLNQCNSEHYFMREIKMNQ